MPTIKPMLDIRQRKSGTYPIVIYVYHRYKARYLPTDFRIEKKYWKKNEVVKHPDAAIINSRVAQLLNQVKQYFAECSLRGKPVDLRLLDRAKKNHSFTGYILDKSEQYLKKGMIVMYQKCRILVKNLEAFRGPVAFDQIDTEFIHDLDAWFIGKGHSPKTRHAKLSLLRKFFNDAVDEGLTEGVNPFKKYSVRLKPVKREKLSPADIAAIENLILEPGPVNDARNLFLFAYYCKGQRFMTCVTVKKSAAQNGRIHFKTNKGEKFISVKIHDRLQKILDFYRDLPVFILPYVKELPRDKRDFINLMGNLNAEANACLKIVAALAGININLTFHIARHTFAFHLKQKTGNINVIQESLGHSDQRTTEIYLKALDDEFLDSELEKLYGK
jgi:integrase/recombinase XerD